MRKLATIVAAVSLAVSAARAGADDQPFELLDIPSTGRTLAAEIADLNGDGLGDVFQLTSSGIPPDEVREIRVFLNAGGVVPTAPSFVLPVPPGSAAYDVGDILPAPGVELILLRARGVTVLSLAQMDDAQPKPVDLLLPGARTLGGAEDERGLDRIEIVSDAFGDEPVLVVPGLGEVFLLAPDGRVRARFDVGGRANYFIQPPGPMLAESDIQLFFDAARIGIGHVNGDELPDVVSATRHEVRVFLNAEGQLPEQPDRIYPLRRVSDRDHIRGSGSVRTAARDIDGDGLLDLLISETQGGITDANAVTSVYLNRGGDWNLAAPDAVFEAKESVSADLLVDLDADGRLELVHYVIPINVLELIEIFVTRAIDAEMGIYRANADGVFGKKPSYARKLGIGLDFDTSRPKGFIPSYQFDLNADGRRDYLDSGDGEAVQIYLASDDLEYGKRHARQELDTAGQVNGGDVNGDGLTDLIFFSARRLDRDMYLATNRGELPGTPPVHKRTWVGPAPAAPEP